MMRWYRSIVGLVLVAIATLLVSCSNGSPVAAPTYTPEKISQISLYADRIAVSQERLPELMGYIQDKNWANIDNFIHGPLGELRVRMVNLANLLLPADQAKAKTLAGSVNTDLQAIHQAVAEFSSLKAAQGFDAFESDLAEFMNLVSAVSQP